MIGKRLIEEKPVALGEVLDIMKEEKKGELDYLQRLAYDYSQKFSEVGAEKSKKMKEELTKLEKMKDSQIIAIIDLMPDTKEDLEVIFMKERAKVEEGDFKTILEIVEKYCK